MSTGHETAEVGGSRLAALSIGALGVVYGDIGTSPIYALREAFHHSLVPTENNVLGVLSVVFWSLVIIISIKYLLFVMRADNEGEGGILALTSLLPKAGPGAAALLLAGLFGTALLYGDGVITPAISVLSAVEGFGEVTSTFDPYILPIAIVILIGLFAVQRFGTGKVGAVFGPIMVIWFLTLAVMGISHLSDDLSVFRALIPTHAITFFAEQPFEAFRSMGSIFLVVTGGEALYADMGHFGRRPIQISWYVLVLPSLLLTYFGQGALLLSHPEAVEHPFYNMVPESLLVPLVILATMATIIASQALISGVFSLTMQATQLGYLPRIRTLHTSATERGQIYIPSVNWALMIGCVALVLGFQTSSNLAAAYGLAVTATMVITALIFARVAVHRWHWQPWKAIALASLFLLIDLAFLGANVLKIPSGGWFPLLVGLVIALLLTTWRRGRQLVAQRLLSDERTLKGYVEGLDAGGIARVPGTAVFLYSLAGRVPPALAANVSYNKVLHETVYVLSITTENVPRVPLTERTETIPLGLGITQVVLHYGFMEEPEVPVDLIRDLGVDVTNVVFFLGRETVLATHRPGMSHWREQLFIMLSRNAASAARFFKLPYDRVFEVGVQVDI